MSTFLDEEDEYDEDDRYDPDPIVCDECGYTEYYCEVCGYHGHVCPADEEEDEDE